MLNLGVFLMTACWMRSLHPWTSLSQPVACDGHGLPTDDLVVTTVTAVESDANIQVNPELIAILQVERDAPFSDKQVYIDTNTVLQVSVDSPEIDANDGDAETNLIGISIKISGDL